MNVVNSFNFHNLIRHEDFLTQTTESEPGTQILNCANSNFESVIMGNKYLDGETTPIVTPNPNSNR